MRVEGLDVGLVEISRWQVDDEQHLPGDVALTQKFLPQAQALDQILRLPSLDERLTGMLQPEGVDSELLDPSNLSYARLGALQLFENASSIAEGEARAALQAVVDIMTNEVALDYDIRAALAALLQG